MKHVAQDETRYDFVIVGARCAGAATSLLLARSGASVLLIEKAAYGSDTLSTHALMRSGVVLLDRWRVLPDIVNAGTPAVRRTTFVYGSEEVPIDIKNGQGVNALYAPRRTVIDRALVDAAIAAGTTVRFGTVVERLVFDHAGRAVGVDTRDSRGSPKRFYAGTVVGAHGVRSTVARQVGARTIAKAKHRTAAVFGYFSGIPNRGYLWSYRPGSSIGAIPTNYKEHCVFALVPAVEFEQRFVPDAANGFMTIVEAHAPQLAREIRAGT